MRRPSGKWSYNSTARSCIWMGSDSSRLLLLMTNWAGNSLNADCNNLGNEPTIPCLSQQQQDHCTRHTYYMFKDLFKDGLYIFTDSTVVHHMEDTGKVFGDDACYDNWWGVLYFFRKLSSQVSQTRRTATYCIFHRKIRSQVSQTRRTTTRHECSLRTRMRTLWEPGWEPGTRRISRSSINAVVFLSKGISGW